LEVRPNPWTLIELKTADEEHGGNKLKNHVLARVKLTRIAILALAAGVLGVVVAGLAGSPELALGLAALTAAGAICGTAEMVGARRIAYRANEEYATELKLTPLGSLLRQPSPEEATASDRKPAQLASQERIAE